MSLEQDFAALQAETARMQDEWRLSLAVRKADELWHAQAMPAGFDVQLTGAETSHAGEIFTLQRAAYVSEAQRYSDAFLPALTQTLDELRTDLAGGTALIARSSMRIVGSVRARKDEEVWRIGRLIVAPDRQGQGIGGRLLNAIEAAAPPSVSEFALFTGASSESNLRLYARHGYKVGHYEDLPTGPGLVHLSKPRADEA